jgi:Domain of unknown function (DUF4352)
VSDQPPWDPWQKQGRPQYPPQQPYGQPPYGQQSYPQGQPPYGQQQPYPPRQPPYSQPGPGQYPGQPPYQGQPYGPPGGQPPYPGQGGPQPPQGPPRRRKRHRVRNLFAGAVGAVIAIIVIVEVSSAGNGDHTVTTGGSPSAAASSAAKAGSTAAPAKVGSTITLAGFSSGEQMAVTVTKIYRHAEPASSFDAPDSGDRLVAVQFRLTDTGSAAYSDSPSNGAAVVDAKGQSYQSSLNNAANCPSFPGTENIAAGASGLGCIVFEVPQAAVITEVQFTLDSGMGPQTGQWDVRR